METLDRIKELDALIEPLEKERAELRQSILTSISKFKVGDIIEWGRRSRRRGEVIEIVEWVCGEPMWKVRRIRNDGSSGEVCKVRPYMNPKLVGLT